MDAMQETAIQTSNFSAEFGQVGGGLFNITMRSGTWPRSMPTMGP